MDAFFEDYKKVNKYTCDINNILDIENGLLHLIEQYTDNIDSLLKNISKINSGYLAFTLNMDTDFTDFIQYIQLSIELNRLKKAYIKILSKNFPHKDSIYDISEVINFLLESPTYKKIEDNYFVPMTQLMFEFSFGNYIRQNQINLVENIYNSIISGSAFNNFHQLLMGQGKSSVIAPYASLCLLTHPKIETVLLVLPKSLVNSMVKNLLKILNGFINIKINTISINRSTTDYNLLNNSNTIHIIDDVSVKSLKLNHIISTGTSRINNMDKTAIIFDEIDDMIDPLKSELNYIDDAQNIDSEYTSNVYFIYTLIYNLYKSEKHNSFRTSYTKFNLIPHLHMTNTDDFVDLVQNIEFQKIVLDAISFSYRNSNVTDSNIQKIFLNRPLEDKNLDFVRKYIHKILGTVLVYIHRRHFGLVDDFSQKGTYKYNYVAVPYFALNKPSKKSEFSSIELTISFTIISYLDSNSHGIRYDDIKMYVMYLLQNAQKMGAKYVNLTEHANEYNKIFKNIDLKPTFMSQYKNFNVSSEMYKHCEIDDNLIEKYIIDAIIPKFITLSTYISNLSLIDIVSSTFCKNRTGFSGTPYFEKPIDLHKAYKIDAINMDLSNEGAIKAAILGAVTKKPKLYGIDIMNLDHIANFIIENSYMCLIDIGCLFISFSTIEIVKYFSQKFSSHAHNNIKAIVFISHNHIKLYADVVTGVIDFMDKNPYSLEHTFVFFDQTHIIGQDIIMSPITTGLITFNYFTTYRDIGQGIYRLRYINYGQNIDYIGYNKLIQKLFPLYDFNLLAKDYKEYTNFNPMDFLQWSISLNEKYRSSQLQSHYIQNIKYLVRETLLKSHNKPSITYLKDSPYIQPNFSDISSPYTEGSFMEDIKSIFYDKSFHFKENKYLFSELKNMFEKYDLIQNTSLHVQTNIHENEVITEKISINSNTVTSSPEQNLHTHCKDTYIYDIFNCNTKKLININNDHSEHKMFYTKACNSRYSDKVSESRDKFNYIIFIQKDDLHITCLRNYEAYVLKQFLNSSINIKQVLQLFETTSEKSDEKEDDKDNVTEGIVVYNTGNIKNIMITTMYGTIIYNKSFSKKKGNNLIKNAYIICMLNAALFFTKTVANEKMVMQLLEYGKENSKEDKILNYIKKNYNHYPFNVYTIDLFNISPQMLYKSVKFIQCLSRVYKFMLREHLIQKIDTKLSDLTHSQTVDILLTILNPDKLNDKFYNNIDSSTVDSRSHECKTIFSSEIEYIQSKRRGKQYYKYLLGYSILFSQNTPMQITDKYTVNSIFDTFHNMMNMKDEFYNELIYKIADKSQS